MLQVEEKQMVIQRSQKHALTVILNLIVFQLDIPKIY